ncbi:tetratricopeptide repeat protein [Saccharicrinis sp. FJH2]|uniref:tetratricopeptide repeat protein n=1 Tax=Saccharicrinis sp. FJH65 TaxID=3344659 RepID=UPI0035F322B1
MNRIKKILLVLLLGIVLPAEAQLNTDRILAIGQNALDFEDYVLSIQYFNQVIMVKPYLPEPYYFRAFAKFNLDDYLGAKQDCDKALENNPFLVDVYNLRGVCYLRLGEYSKANEDFSTGLKYDPNNSSLIMNKGISRMAVKDYKDAIEDYTEAIKLKSDFAKAYLNRGNAYLDMNDTLKAIPDFEKVIELNPYNPDGYANLGRIDFEQKKYKAAEENFDMAVRLEPDEPIHYLKRALTRYFQKDYMDALSDFDKAISLDPNNSDAYFNRGLILSEIMDNNRAVEDFSMVLNIAPDNYKALFNRGLIHNQLGNAFNAIDDFNRVINKYPDFAPAYYARAEARQMLGDQSGMQKDINMAYNIEAKADERKKNDKKELENVNLTKKDESPDKKDTDIINFKKIVIFNESKKSKFASNIRGQIQNRNIVIDLEKEFVLSLYPDDPKLKTRQNYYVSLIESFNRNSGLNKTIYLTNDNQTLSEKQVDEHFQTIETISQRIDMYPNSAISYMERALNYDMVKDFSSAIKDLNKVVEIKRDWAIAYFYRAALRYKTVEFVLSIENEIAPDANVNTNNNGRQLLTGGQGTADFQTEKKILDYDLILSDYNKVLELEPNFAFAWYNRGIVHTILKDYKVALNDYTEAIRLEPELAEAYFNRGLTNIYLGNLEQGNKDLSKAGELGLYKAYNVLKRYGLQNRN